jgi:ribosomal protein L7/L12
MSANCYIQHQYTAKWNNGAATLTIEPHVVDLIQTLYRVEQTVPAIKFARAQYNLGLKDAKDLCDPLAEFAEYRQ